MSTLLLVDDNESVLIVLDLFFAAHGHVVLRASGGQEALALVAGRPVHAAIVDVHMPGLNGFDVCRLLQERAAETGHHLPVWLITGGYSGEIVERARRMGAIDVFRKPFEFDQLRSVLTRLDSIAADSEPPQPGARDTSGTSGA